MGPRARVLPRHAGGTMALVLAAAVLTACAAKDAPGPPHAAPPSTDAPSAGPVTQWRYRTLSQPSGTRVLDADGRTLATFTLGARTVVIRGGERIFAEPRTTSSVVITPWWVRVLPAPFEGTVDTSWLRRRLRDESPDVLAVAMQYVTGAPTVRSGSRPLRSDAAFGPLLPDGSREEGADFNDYLGVTWRYPGRVDVPEPDQKGALDCSGFLRMVYGYRMGIPLSWEPDGVSMPRFAAQLMADGPGVVVAPFTGRTPPLEHLAPGDLVFFDNVPGDGNPANHSGIYLGRDRDGGARFVSSRMLVNGPSMGDVGSESLLSGRGLYAESWRAARRL